MVALLGTIDDTVLCWRDEEVVDLEFVVVYRVGRAHPQPGGRSTRVQIDFSFLANCKAQKEKRL